MIHIKEILKAMKPQDSVTIGFKAKQPVEQITKQDKQHIRIMAILQLAHDRELMYHILNHEFTESFKYDEKEQLLIYKIRFKKERRPKYRGDC